MSARTAEIVQICAPVKSQIRHLDSQSQRLLPELLNKIVSRMRRDGYKLVHVTKSYRKKGADHSDSFWRKELTKNNIKIVWFCTLTISFKRGFTLNFDFDFWFEFEKLLGILRADLYKGGFPYTSRRYAEKFAKREATQILEKVKKSVREVFKSKVRGWGIHGITSDVTERESLDICHHKDFSISSFPEIDELRKTLRSIEEAGLKTVEESSTEVHELARKKLSELVPFPIRSGSLEGYLALFLWFRKPRGAFEYQLYRFTYENYRRKIIRKRDIREALLRLEVHGYTKVKETPRDSRRRLEGEGIRRCRRFYEIGPHDPPGRELFQHLKGKVELGAHLDPLPRRRLIKSLGTPNHLADKSIRELTRKNILSEKRVYNCLGRTVRKIKPKRRPRRLKGLDREIIKKADHYYEIQKNALDQMQEKS